MPELLALPKGRSFVEEDVRRVVANCPKQRFLLKEMEGGPLMIRANQGHSMEVCNGFVTEPPLRFPNQLMYMYICSLSYQLI